MVTWQEFTAAEPQLAEAVRGAFTLRKHAVMATLRRDGSPRVSGTEIAFDGADAPLIGMPGDAVRVGDLRADPRTAVHSPTVDPPDGDPGAWPGEAKIAGRAVRVPGEPLPGAVSYRIDVTEVVLTRIAPAGDHLVITSWHPATGRREHRRT